MLSSGGGGSDESSSGSGEPASDRSSRRERRRRARRATYTVRAGDTLGSIARRNDTSVDRIEELSPQLDSQALTAGQRVKLRE